MREFLGAARPQTPRCVFHIYDTGHKAPYYTISPTIFGNVTLTKGAGIPHDELKSRVVSSTDKDLRFYLIKEIEKRGKISPEVVSNWKFIPEDFVKDAVRRDRKTLFGD